MTKDLTQQMIDNFSKYLKPEAVERFAKRAREDEKFYGGPITRIEDIPFPDGSPGIMEKHYFYADETEPDKILDYLHAGVDSL